MGTKYEFNQVCPNCKKDIEVYYAPTCGIDKIECYNCNKLFKIIMRFDLEEVVLKTKKKENVTCKKCLARLKPKEKD